MTIDNLVGFASDLRLCLIGVKNSDPCVIFIIAITLKEVFEGLDVFLKLGGGAAS